MLSAGDTLAPLPVPKGFDGYTQALSTISERQFQLQSAIPEARAECLRLQNGNDWGFVAVGVLEAARPEGVAP